VPIFFIIFFTSLPDFYFTISFSSCRAWAFKIKLTPYWPALFIEELFFLRTAGAAAARAITARAAGALFFWITAMGTFIHIFVELLT